MFRTSRVLMIAGVMAMFAIAASAQNKKKDKEEGNLRSLQGQVFNQQDQPLVGAVVQLKDTRTLQVRSFIAQEQGNYHFSGLKTDVDYEVKADYNGMSSDSRRLSVFDSRKVAVINLKVK